MKTRTFLSLALFGSLLALPVRAALVWENPEAELHPTITDQTAVAHFKYKNTGDKPIKITHVQPSCGCTTAALAKDTVAPGESGEIVATLQIGSRSGVLPPKTIHVTTDEPNGQGSVLTIKAIVPKLLDITPAFIHWTPTEPRDPKTIDVKVGAEFPVTKLDVTSTDPAVKLETTPVPNEKAFRIKVTPPEGNRPIVARLQIVPDFPKDNPRPFFANVQVSAPPGARPPMAPVAMAPPRPLASPAASSSPAAPVPPPR